MKIAKVIELILNACDEKRLCFFTNGFISRIGFSIKDRAQNFYMIGSMGLVSSVGLGVALNTSKKVIILDGDGSILMNMGVMPLICYENPKNLIHFVFDNRVYGSTGNQPTISSTVDFYQIAQSCGYKNIFSFRGIKDFEQRLKTVIGVEGPTFVHLLIDPEERLDYPRISISPDRLSRRIKKTISN